MLIGLTREIFRRGTFERKAAADSFAKQNRGLTCSRGLNSPRVAALRVNRIQDELLIHSGYDVHTWSFGPFVR